MKEDLNHCERDYKSHHYWMRVGVWGLDYVLYTCSQCQKSKLVRIHFLNGVHVEDE